MLTLYSQMAFPDIYICFETYISSATKVINVSFSLSAQRIMVKVT